MKIGYLHFVHFDSSSNNYELEFHINGEIEFITVDANEHPEAATVEDYFDNEEVIEKIIAEGGAK